MPNLELFFPIFLRNDTFSTSDARFVFLANGAVSVYAKTPKALALLNEAFLRESERKFGKIQKELGVKERKFIPPAPLKMHERFDVSYVDGEVRLSECQTTGCMYAEKELLQILSWSFKVQILLFVRFLRDKWIYENAWKRNSLEGFRKT